MESNLRDREDVENFIRSIMMPGAMAILAGGEAQRAEVRPTIAVYHAARMRAARSRCELAPIFLKFI